MKELRLSDGISGKVSLQMTHTFKANICRSRELSWLSVNRRFHSHTSLLAETDLVTSSACFSAAADNSCRYGLHLVPSGSLEANNLPSNLEESTP